MELGMFILLMACLLAVAVFAVRHSSDSRPSQTKKTQHKEAPMSNEKVRLFYIEHVPAEMRKLEIGGFSAAAQTQRELLKAGDELLRKLPGDIRKSLGCPISSDLTKLLSQGDDLSNLTPQRVRAAVVVAEVSFALWVLMFDSGMLINQPPHQVVLTEQIGMLTAGKQKSRVSSVIKQISLSIRVPLGVAIAMWEGVVAMLRESRVSVPGLKAGKPPAETLGEE